MGLSRPPGDPVTSRVLSLLICRMGPKGECVSAQNLRCGDEVALRDSRASRGPGSVTRVPDVRAGLRWPRCELRARGSGDAAACSLAGTGGAQKEGRVDVGSLGARPGQVGGCLGAQGRTPSCTECRPAAHTGGGGAGWGSTAPRGETRPRGCRVGLVGRPSEVPFPHGHGGPPPRTPGMSPRQQKAPGPVAACVCVSGINPAWFGGCPAVCGRLRLPSPAGEWPVSGSACVCTCVSRPVSMCTCVHTCTRVCQ